MASKSTIEIRDIREQPFFWLDVQFVDHYMPQLTLTAALLYLVLCRYANGSTQQCWPSQSKLAEMMQIKKRDTVRLAAQKLSEVGLVGYEQIGTGPHSKTVYTLLRIPPANGGLSPLKDAFDPPSRVSQTKRIEQQETLLLVGEDEKPITKAKKNEHNGSDPRHREFHDLIFRCYRYMNGSESPWGPSDAKQLSSLLKEKPDITAFEFSFMLKHYSESENINCADRPSKFLPRITSYMHGPLDQFGRQRVPAK